MEAATPQARPVRARRGVVADSAARRWQKRLWGHALHDWGINANCILKNVNKCLKESLCESIFIS